MAGRTRMSVEIEGLGRLREQLEELAPQIEAAVKRAVKESAEAVRDETRRGVRVDTGNLRDKVDITYKDEGLSAEVGWSDRSDWYAAVQEHGTRRMPANPVLGPALERERNELPRRVRTEVRRELR
ncbi:HK97 gp10 family phage protein [Streptomyces sp. NBC_01216]|uniref:HK97-gp10 family putative phage morphogenesis protein n=1 Tax=Streptomyces sp. NBC_01216 TaxID=2903778 RepID=UPI002E0ED9B7|nr:HK97 gp10 family phage protein [Streptomyces sp. NBC_01216]